MADEQEVSAGFPTAGLDVTCEFGRQPSDTTPDSQNVRSVETLANRFRGGSRPGISRYIDEQVSGSNLIQHLAVLVDPQQPGLRADSDQDFPDPSTNNLRTRVPPGRRIRLGGSAISPLGNDEPSSGAGPDIVFVQKKVEQPGFTVTLGTQPNQNDLVIAIVRTSTVSSGGEDPASVKNGDGDLFMQVGGPGYSAEFLTNLGQNIRLQMFYRIVQGLPADATVQVERGGPTGTGTIYETAVLVYRNSAQGGPLSNKTKVSVTVGVSSMPFGSLAMNGTSGQMCLGVIASYNTQFLMTPETESDFNPRFGVRDSGGNVVTTSANMGVVDRLHIAGVAPQNPIVTTDAGDREYCAILTAWTR